MEEWTAISTEMGVRSSIILFHEDLFFQIFGAYFAQVFGPIEAVGEEDAVEVVDFVLEDAGEPAFGGDFDCLATHVLTFDHDFCGAPDIVAGVARDAETAFAAKFLAFGFRNFGVEHSNLAIFIFGDEDADGLSDLWSGEADALGGVHGIEHVFDELWERWVEVMYFLRFLAKDRVFCSDYFAQCHCFVDPYYSSDLMI